MLIIVPSHQPATAEGPETAVGIESVTFSLHRGGPSGENEALPTEPAFSPDIYDYTVRTSKNMKVIYSIQVVDGSEILIERGEMDPVEFPFHWLAERGLRYSTTGLSVHTTLSKWMPGDLKVTLSPGTDEAKLYTFRLQDKPDKITHKPAGLEVETTPSGWMWIDWFDPVSGGIPGHYIVSVKPLDGGKSHSQRVKGSRYAIFEDLPAGEYRIWVRGQNRLGKGPKAKINFTHR